MAFWADEFELLPSDILSAGVTFDADFLGSRREAELTADQLAQRMPGKVEILLPDLDRHTANSAKILIHGFGNRTDPVEIDYVAGVFGFDPGAERRLRKRAIPVESPQGVLAVMHPIDCLISRVMNLDGLPSKRNNAGIAQCRLAVAVTRAFITNRCSGSSKPAIKTALKAVETVAELATTAAAKRIAIGHDINVLDAIPADAICSEQFHTQRWPQIQKAAAEGIDKLRRQRERRHKRDE